MARNTKWFIRWIMINYKIQNGCHNCSLVFIKYDYDQFNEYYCTYNTGERPMCFSVAMGEILNQEGKDYKKDEEEYEQHYKLWDDWSKDIEVQPWGICDKWELRKVK